VATQLIVASPFPGYTRGQVITDPIAISAVLSGPYSDQVRAVILATSSGGGSSTISGVPSTIQAGTLLTGTYTAAQPGYFICIRVAGADQLPRVALPGVSGALPALFPAAAGASTVAMYSTASGGAPLAETGAITVTVGATSGVLLPANAFVIGTDANGAPVPITLAQLIALLGGAAPTTPTAPDTTNALVDGFGTYLADDAGVLLLAA